MHVQFSCSCCHYDGDWHDSVHDKCVDVVMVLVKDTTESSTGMVLLWWYECFWPKQNKKENKAKQNKQQQQQTPKNNKSQNIQKVWSVT